MVSGEVGVRGDGGGDPRQRRDLERKRPNNSVEASLRKPLPNATPGQ